MHVNNIIQRHRDDHFSERLATMGETIAWPASDIVGTARDLLTFLVEQHTEIQLTGVLEVPKCFAPALDKFAARMFG